MRSRPPAMPSGPSLIKTYSVPDLWLGHKRRRGRPHASRGSSGALRYSRTSESCAGQAPSCSTRYRSTAGRTRSSTTSVCRSPAARRSLAAIQLTSRARIPIKRTGQNRPIAKKRRNPPRPSQGKKIRRSWRGRCVFMAKSRCCSTRLPKTTGQDCSSA